jgi:V/A-type H+-transporting ATPase subunit F
VAILGKREEILCFSALGVEVIDIKNIDDAREKLFKAKKAKLEGSETSHYAIIFVMEDIIAEISDDDMKKLTADALPAIIALPGHKGASGQGDLRIRKIVEKAVGTDILLTKCPPEL